MSGLLRTWRMGLCVMFALFLAGMVAAQVSPAAQLTIEPTCAWRIRIHAAMGVWYKPRQCACHP